MREVEEKQYRRCYISICVFNFEFHSSPISRKEIELGKHNYGRNDRTEEVCLVTANPGKTFLFVPAFSSQGNSAQPDNFGVGKVF